MKQWIKPAALLLGIAILITCLAIPVVNWIDGTSAPALTDPTDLPVWDPTTTPTTIPTTEATEEITSVPTTEPITEPVTEPVTEPPTQPETTPTEPTQPKPVTPPLTEPPASAEVTIGEKISGITAKKAFVYDCETKSFLYMKSDADAKLYPASITKLMNVYTALKYLDKDTVVTVDASMLSIVPDDTSKAGLYSGNQMTVENLIKAVLVASGSDAAHVMAVFTGRIIAGDPNLGAQAAEDVFVAAMNEQATTLGLVNSHFMNCDGYSHADHYTCMADLVTIGSLCLDTPLIRDTVKNGKVTLTFTNGKTRSLTSTNYLLRQTSTYYRKEACGLKTGTTNASGANLLSAFWVEDHYILIGTFGCPTYNSRYSNTVKLFDLFKNYVPPVVEPEPDDPTTGATSEPTEEPTIPTEPVTEATTSPTEIITEPTEVSTTVTEETSEPTEPTQESEQPPTE